MAFMNKPPRKYLGNNMQCYFCGSESYCRGFSIGNNTTVHACRSCYPPSAHVWDFLTIAGLLIGGLILSAVVLLVGGWIFVSAYGLAESWVKSILGLEADQSYSLWAAMLMLLLTGVIIVCGYVCGLFLVLYPP